MKLPKGYALDQTFDRAEYDFLIGEAPSEFEPAFSRAINCWCGIEQRLYPLEYWQVYVARDSKGAVGAVIGLYSEKPIEAGEFWIGWFYVEAGARGCGLGSALVEAMTAKARNAGADILKVYTGPQNSAARRLYGRLGFSVAGSMKGHPYPQDGASEGDIILAKSLV